MNRTSMTYTSDDVGHNLSKIVDYFLHTRECPWSSSLAVIDQQDQGLRQTIRGDWANRAHTSVTSWGMTPGRPAWVWAVRDMRRWEG
jgi:hypothetical protein